MRTLSAVQREIMRLRFADIPAAHAAGGALFVPLFGGGVSGSAVSGVTSASGHVDIGKTTVSVDAARRSPVAERGERP
jgi:hypothetical protein